ncbi:MAG TPA: YceI family protein, partial [Alphaproteobacteria bacterium]|nr:YceI family protein [Alphaproteobacteria bacterium]
TIDTNSLTMDDDAWEKHLKNEDFFNVEKFPAMTFKSTKVEKTGDNTGRVTGDLTLLGVTKPVTLDVIFNKGGIHPYSKKYVAGFSATGKLNRSEFGMTYGLPGVGDEVNISIEVEGIREEPAADKQ